MTLRIVGAGLPRTGTNSLKLGFERLLGGPCYHMLELFDHPEDIPTWRRAAGGEHVDWAVLFDRYRAVVDWPASAFWAEQADAFPDALVLLSTRSDPLAWWHSMEGTIMIQRELPARGPQDGPMAAFGPLMGGLSRRFCPEPQTPEAMIAAYEQHNATVRATVPATRLIDWMPEDGWEPLCVALGLPVPDEPFPHVNTTAEFNARIEQGPPGGGPRHRP